MHLRVIWDAVISELVMHQSINVTLSLFIPLFSYYHLLANLNTIIYFCVGS